MSSKMKLKEKFSSFNKNSKLSEDIKEQINKLPTNEEVTHEILSALGNNHTKIVLDKDIKDSYYVYLNDTIYLSDRDKVKENPSRIMLISHESRHSVQSKILQKLNFLLSNIEIIVFIINVVLLFLKRFTIVNIYSYISIVIVSLVPRMILEFDAVINSIKIAKEYLKKKLEKSSFEKIINIYKFKLKLLMPFFVINLISQKVIRLLILIIAYHFIN